jgi:hypothetical protein
MRLIALSTISGTTVGLRGDPKRSTSEWRLKVAVPYRVFGRALWLNERVNRDELTDVPQRQIMESILERICMERSSFETLISELRSEGMIIEGKNAGKLITYSRMGVLARNFEEAYFEVFGLVWDGGPVCSIGTNRAGGEDWTFSYALFDSEKCSHAFVLSYLEWLNREEREAEQLRYNDPQMDFIL